MAAPSSFLKPIYIGVLVFLAVLCQIRTVVSNEPVLNVAVIGAGACGLASAKYSLAQGYNVTVFEQAEDFGGVWWYTDQVGKDKYGINVHSAMYKGLRTNAPYQVMEYHDFPYPKNTIPYPPQVQIYNYIHAYADHFNVTEHIKLNHYVVRVTPIENGRWEVIVRDLPNNKYITATYDIVFVANGHYAVPRYPDIPGIEEFKGKVMHSHDYRRPEPFRGESVLIIGGGKSGSDLVVHLSKVAERITFSQHKIVNETEEEREIRQKQLPLNTLLQDNVRRFTATGAEFIDGTHEEFSVIIFATGYQYSFPFLSVDTGITVDKKCVYPLYQQVFNIEHPTLVFIGVPHSNIPVYELQVRYALKFISGEKKLPTKAEMLEDVRVQEKTFCKASKKDAMKYNTLGAFTKYPDELSDAAGIEHLSRAMVKIMFNNYVTRMLSLSQFRNYKYTVVDENNFKKEKFVLARINKKIVSY